MTTTLAPDRHSKLLADRRPGHQARYSRRGSRVAVSCSCRLRWSAPNLRHALVGYGAHGRP